MTAEESSALAREIWAARHTDKTTEADVRGLIETALREASPLARFARYLRAAAATAAVTEDLLRALELVAAAAEKAAATPQE